MAGTISTTLLGEFVKIYDINNHKERYGYVMCAFVFFSYLGSVPWFILAGMSYKKHLLKKWAEEAE